MGGGLAHRHNGGPQNTEGARLAREILKHAELERREKLFERRRKADNDFVRRKLASGAWGSKINSDKQAAHNEFTHEAGKSYLLKGVSAQELFDRYAGTGIMDTTRNGKRKNTERIVLDGEIGIAISKRSIEYTNVVKIHHSKNRTHIVPIQRKAVKK